MLCRCVKSVAFERNKGLYFNFTGRCDVKRLQGAECHVHVVVVGFGNASTGPAVVVVGEFGFPGSVFTVPSAEFDRFAQEFAEHFCASAREYIHHMFTT